MYGTLRASTLTGAQPDEGFKRAWMEFDRTNTGWSSGSEFEFNKPDDSYGGNGTTSVSIGFGSALDFSLGEGPLQAGGGVNLDYYGTVTKSTENWHPIVRAEGGSGGVQWCRYEFDEFTGTRTIATRVNFRVSSSGTNGGWYILRGQSDDYTACPSQM